MRKKILIVSLVMILLAGGILTVFLIKKPHKAPETNNNQTSQNVVTQQTPPTVQEQSPEPAQPQPEQPKAFNKSAYSLTDPASIWVVVNKKRSLPSGYTPSGLTTVGGGQMKQEAATALNSLLGGAKNQGISLGILSAYRSYGTQQVTYNGYVAKDGQAAADIYSARPGYSEHQTGWAVDLGNGTCDLEICFANTPAGKWLAANAHTYGFVIRYPDGKTAITGYQYEPWHIRYVGNDLAAAIHNSNQTMEEFFGLEAAPSY